MTILVNGIELHWEEAGEGEPLLWLHGALGCGSDWRYVFEQAPAGYRIIAPDLRGHGASTNPTGQFTFRQCARDIVKLLEHTGVSRIDAIGVSGGGIVLLHLAVLEPALLQSMVIVSAPSYFPVQARSVMRQYSRAMLSTAEIERMRACHTRGDQQIDQLFVMVHGFADSYDDVNFTPPYLTTITADTLIVFGDRDPLYPLSIAVEMHQSMPRSYLWVVPNGGHAPVFGEAAALFRSTALSFLRGDWKPGAV